MNTTKKATPVAPSWKENTQEMVLQQFGAKLKKLRLSKGFTQEQFTELVEDGANRSYISQVENGHKAVTIWYLYKIADALSMTMSELVAGI